MGEKRPMFATIPVSLEFPEEMAADVASVLSGEYEAGHDGEDLTILDIGANVGAFSIWASLRWPRSTIHAYEPNPGTFRMLVGNVARLSNVTCHEQAVFPGEAAEHLLYSRYAGDGESGLVDYIGNTFANVGDGHVVPVRTVHPRALPAADLVKIDVEGGEASILEAMDLSGVSLVLLEYQDMANRRSIEQRLGADFTCEYMDCFPWSRILPRSGYNTSLAGDSYGHLFFVNKRANRLRRSSRGAAAQDPQWPVDPCRLSLRQVVAALPGAARRSLASRLGWRR